MTIRDISTGPDWVIWVAFAIIMGISVLLLSGHGANLIAGYNTSTPEEKAKYNRKKLCRVTGGGMLLIAVLILIMGIGQDVLPAYVAYIFGGIVIADCVVMIILANTLCKK